MVAEVPIAEARTSQHKVYLAVPEGFVPNQSVRVRLLLPTTGLFLPENAILQRGNLTYVLVQTQGKPQKRLVRVGLAMPDGSRQIQAGLTEGETVLVAEAAHD